MRTASCPTNRYDIFLAGDIAVARQVAREVCFPGGLCVTIEACDFVYAGGLEAGVRVGLLNYPRFPEIDQILHAKATELANALMERLCQHTYLIVGKNDTEWVSRRPEL